MRTLLKYTAQTARQRGIRRVSGAHDYSAPTRAVGTAGAPFSKYTKIHPFINEIKSHSVQVTPYHNPVLK